MVDPRPRKGVVIYLGRSATSPMPGSQAKTERRRYVARLPGLVTAIVPTRPRPGSQPNRCRWATGDGAVAGRLKRLRAASHRPEKCASIETHCPQDSVSDGRARSRPCADRPRDRRGVEMSRGLRFCVHLVVTRRVFNGSAFWRQSGWRASDASGLYERRNASLTQSST